MEETAEQGFAEWEVRVELPSHRETVAFAEQLQREGFPVVRRWSFLLVGAPGRGPGHRRGREIHSEAPEGTRVHAEVSGAAVWNVCALPFAIFGGLGAKPGLAVGPEDVPNAGSGWSVAERGVGAALVVVVDPVWQ